jgi:hypothetical protein
MNVNGQKKLIELFGNYWHEEGEEISRVSHFGQYGFKTLVIWEEDFLDRPEEMMEKLEAFHLQ